MPQIYHINVIKEDSETWEIFITETLDSQKAAQEAMDYFAPLTDEEADDRNEYQLHSREDVFEAYNITESIINGYKLRASKPRN